MSWRDSRLRAVLRGESPKGLPTDLIKATRHRLERLNIAERVEDLRTPRGHRLHQLSGDWTGQWSISVNDQFRICFVWGPGGPEDVEFVDYH